MKKLLLLIIFFYILTLLQTSFLIHLIIFPNLILIFQILVTLFEEPKKDEAIFSAFFAGFFLDIFSEKPIGYGILVLISLSLFLKIILRRYVRIPIFRRF